ncbi:MAG: hypothetical protein DKT66_13515 [Candidatus Melainabacteria bacterium]|nr:MAG: hypothetical protein DKT66_13515 [Candidatus Melainabacteria bacterium]
MAARVTATARANFFMMPTPGGLLGKSRLYSKYEPVQYCAFLASNRCIFMPQLPVPEKLNQEKGVEILRVWAEEGNLAVVTNTKVNSDPAFFGIALADLLNHLSFICAQKSGKSQEESRKEIMDVFYKECGPQ